MHSVTYFRATIEIRSSVAPSGRRGRLIVVVRAASQPSARTAIVRAVDVQRRVGACSSTFDGQRCRSPSDRRRFAVTGPLRTVAYRSSYSA
ncbi:unnamed protein product [Angiostrongylus costaricensis]|uniref:Secreted protein n=1 Tax=Angiostrongylus costaricensis TaxID=334426 RepID=A0A0R3Q0S8_ANGCS|nr:unnamed protein product [Angiostrongylus costaricensis]